MSCSARRRSASTSCSGSRRWRRAGRPQPLGRSSADRLEALDDPYARALRRARRVAGLDLARRARPVRDRRRALDRRAANGPAIHRAGLTDYAVGLAYAGGAAGGKAVTLMQEDIDWSELPKGAQGRQAVAVGRGLMLAAPLLFLFGALFVAADSVFQDYVRALFRTRASSRSTSA